MISYSQIATYLKCRKSFDYSYNQRIEPRRVASVIQAGTLGHIALAALHLKQDPVAAIDTAIENQLKSMGDMLTVEFEAEARVQGNMMLKVAERAYEALIPDRWETVPLNGKPLVEQPVGFKIYGVDVGGTPDWVSRDKITGNIWLWDYKFRSKFLPAESEMFNLQMLFYIGVLAKNGIEVAGTRQYQIRPHMPLYPETISRGTKMSRRAIATDWPTYKAALLDFGFEPTEYYEEMVPKLADIKWFDHESTKTLRSHKEVDNAWQTTILPIVKDIASGQARDERSLGYYGCQRCQYRDLCVAELRGDDAEYIRAATFKTKGEASFPGFTLIEDDNEDI